MNAELEETNSSLEEEISEHQKTALELQESKGVFNIRYWYWYKGRRHPQTLQLLYTTRQFLFQEIPGNRPRTGYLKTIG